MKKINTIQTLKNLRLTDDQILELAIEDRLTHAANMLIAMVGGLWKFNKLQAMAVIETLRQELN